LFGAWLDRPKNGAFPYCIFTQNIFYFSVHSGHFLCFYFFALKLFYFGACDSNANICRWGSSLGFTYISHRIHTPSKSSLPHCTDIYIFMTFKSCKVRYSNISLLHIKWEASNLALEICFCSTFWFFVLKRNIWFKNSEDLCLTSTRVGLCDNPRFPSRPPWVLYYESESKQFSI